LKTLRQRAKTLITQEPGQQADLRLQSLICLANGPGKPDMTLADELDPRTTGTE